jgi:hypothetical protein
LVRTHRLDRREAIGERKDLPGERTVFRLPADTDEIRPERMVSPKADNPG